jgi:hypothetical protein
MQNRKLAVEMVTGPTMTPKRLKKEQETGQSVAQIRVDQLCAPQEERKMERESTVRRLVAVTAAFALVLALVALVAPIPARAGGCDYYTYSSTTYDFASISDGNNDCWEISVRHYYDPPWSSNNYWTDWHSSWGTYASTPVMEELLYGDFDATFPPG